MIHELETLKIRCLDISTQQCEQCFFRGHARPHHLICYHGAAALVEHSVMSRLPATDGNLNVGYQKYSAKLALGLFMC